MKNPVLVVRFSMVERDELTPEHTDTQLTGMHLVRMYAARDIADGRAGAGFIVGTEVSKFWESAILMGALE